MGLLDGLQDLLGSVTDNASQQLGDVVSQVGENEVVQSVQEQVAGATEGLGDIPATIEEQGQGMLDNLDPRNFL